MLKYDWSTEKEVAELLEKAKTVSKSCGVNIEVKIGCNNPDYEDDVYFIKDGERVGGKL